jgi:hypothetical protein
MEPDAITHWSKQNKMTESQFAYALSKRYIDILTNNIQKDDLTIILSGSTDNPVIGFLRNNGYNFSLTRKFYREREKNAIVDLLISKECNGVFVGNFNMTGLNGSTFSYFIATINNISSPIMIDLDNLNR